MDVSSNALAWRRPLALLIVLASAALSGCAPVYSTTGKLLSDYAEDHVTPYIHSSRDVDMAACGTGVGMHQFLGSFSRVMSDPDYVMFYTGLLNGFCAEFRATDHNLRYLRASHAGNVTEASDARTTEKRWYAVAAERRYNAFKHVTEAYGPLRGECPDLDTERDQAAYLIGLVIGLQAVQSDLRSGSQVGVPRDIALGAARAAQCLDNERWWGVPQAIRATVWTFVPGSTPEDQSPWQVFQQSAELAEDSGMRLALALYGIGADNVGNTKQLKNAIRLAGEIDPDRAPENYALVDRLARSQLLHLSDQLWTRETGKRTPIGALGEFPGNQSDKPDTEGLL